MAKKRASSSNVNAETVKKIDNLKNVKWLGEIITWNAGSDQKHTHKAVVQALRDAGLDPDVAKELLPRFAFSRAAKKMSDERVIDAASESDSTITFQFTKKFMEKNEWKFSTETFLTLDKVSGLITCPDSDLRDMAQARLEEAIKFRTTSDITKIVQKLFERNADLFPVRDQGGCYFVPIEHQDFVARIEKFLVALSGSIRRFPIPSGTESGDKSVQLSMTDSIKALIEDHITAVNGFTLNTRGDTIDNAARRINETRVKIQAYASYLSDSASELLKRVEEADQELVKRVNGLTEERKTLPADAGRAANKIFNESVTAIIRWMAADGWSFDKIKVALERQKVSVAEATIRTQMNAGRKKKGSIPDLTIDQVAELVPPGFDK